MAATSPEAIARKRANRKAVEKAKRQEAAAERRSTWVAIDGEAVQLPSGKQRYLLMATSAGDRITRKDAPLSTSECLTWLCKIIDRHKGARFVAFYFDYDVNHWLRDLSEDELAQAWDSQEVEVELADGRICVFRYMPGSSFEIGILNGAKRDNWGRIEDVRGWMQGNLLTACAAWGIDIPADAAERIARYKEARGTFESDDLAEIALYCHQECELLAETMARVEDCVVGVGVRPARWHGPGSAAAALMRQNGILQQMAPVTERIRSAQLAAYYGGRVQPQCIGLVGDAITYDIRSAYPWALAQLPSMRGKWTEVAAYDPNAKYAIWRCSWDVSGEIIAPFPFRVGGGSIHWPAIGKGAYWSPEVAVAMEKYADRITIDGGVVFTPADADARPFAFMKDIYRYRRQVQSVSPQHADAAKLIANAVYGKTAQGRTIRDKQPELQSFFWAGLATSLVRARMLEAAFVKPECVVLFQTDALTTTERIALDEGTGLGQWREVASGDAFVLSSGVMELRGHGVSKSKMRGIAHQAAGLTDWDVMRFLWKRDGWDMKYLIPLRRFVGMGSAISMRRMDLWRAWITMNVRVTTAPTRAQPRPLTEHSWRLMPTQNAEVKDTGTSLAYKSITDLPSGDEQDSRFDRILEREQPVPTGA